MPRTGKKKPAKPKTAAGPALELVPASVVAYALGLAGPRQVYELAAAGKIPRGREGKRGQFELAECTRAYCTHMREVAAGRMSRDGKVDLVTEKARLASEQADGQALKNAMLRGELVPADEVQAVHVAIHSAVQRRLLGLPRTCAPLVAVENEPRTCEAILRDYVEKALEKVADLTVETFDDAAAEEHAPQH